LRRDLGCIGSYLARCGRNFLKKVIDCYIPAPAAAAESGNRVTHWQIKKEIYFQNGATFIICGYIGKAIYACRLHKGA